MTALYYIHKCTHKGSSHSDACTLHASIVIKKTHTHGLFYFKDDQLNKTYIICYSDLGVSIVVNLNIIVMELTI